MRIIHTQNLNDSLTAVSYFNILIIIVIILILIINLNNNGGLLALYWVAREEGALFAFFSPGIEREGLPRTIIIIIIIIVIVIVVVVIIIIIIIIITIIIIIINNNNNNNNNNNTHWTKIILTYMSTALVCPYHSVL